ncbi:hypothetical protein HYV89_00190 [Candidatus Woesearchaeota archaeon]|nr:hypothetical protein [Candidatus Woesearchaeota archaeon]
MNKDILIKLGLTDGESKVYLSLLKIGSSTVGPIVKEADVAYSNVYDILARLLEKGLISFIIKEKTKHFQAVPPSRLNEFLNKKEEKLQEEKLALKSLIPELEKIQNPESKQEAEIFIGLKGIKTAYHKMIEESNKKEEWLFFYVDEGQKTDEFYASMYPKFKKIPSKGIANKDYKKSKFIQRTNFKMKYVNFPFPGTIDIYNDKILFISWKPVPTGILITSEDITQKFKDYFYSIWNQKV